jgi:DNA polymerase III sliding clamp (beta) subunit (PCNA family)
MNISASDFKHALKKLSPVKTETYRFDMDGICAQDSDVIIAVAPDMTFGGTFNVNGKNLSRVVNRMTGQIEIVQEQKKLILTSAKARIELEIQPVKPVPLPEATETPLVLDLTDFKKALALTVPSASTAKSAKYGGAVQIQSGLGGYRVVGTDGLVLTVATVINTAMLAEFKTLLNLTAASIVQLMDGESISIQDSFKYFVLKSRDTTVYASKPVQEYPNFEPLLAMKSHTVLGFKTEEWWSALRTVDPLIDDEKDNGAVSGFFRNNVVQWEGVGIGSVATDEAAYEQLEPDPIFDPKELELKINAKHLSGFLSRAGTEATLGITEKPIRLESEGVVVLTMPIGAKK